MKNALIAAAVAALVAAASSTAATIIVTSKNIKNGTIQTVDISAKAKRALNGNRGQRGPAGVPGASGAQAVPGPQGPRGPSTALIGEHNVIVGDVPDTEANVGHISLPRGNYVVFAKAAFVNPAFTETLVQCGIAQSGTPPGSTFERGNLRLLASGGVFDAGVVTLVAHLADAQFAGPTMGLDFRCHDSGGSAQFFDQFVRAIQVESVQSSP